jgi:nicotinate phosphoribosyltransferase
VVADMIYLKGEDIDKETFIIIDPMDPTKRKKIFTKGMDQEILLKPIFRNGEMIYKIPDIHTIRERAKTNLSHFDKAHKRLVNPHTYPVGLEESLYQLRTDLVFKMKNYNGE